MIMLNAEYIKRNLIYNMRCLSSKLHVKQTSEIFLRKLKAIKFIDIFFLKNFKILKLNCFYFVEYNSSFKIKKSLFIEHLRITAKAC